MELTSYCNLKCPACARSSDMKDFIDRGHLSLDFLKEHITFENFPELNNFNMSGTISDNMMHPDIEAIIDWGINEMGVNVSITTNGSMRTPKFWKKLGETYTKEQLIISFAIDGLDEETNALYRIGSSYKKAMGNARAFIEAGGKAVWQFIVFPWNEHQVEDYKRVCKEYGFANTRLVGSTRGAADKKDHIDAYEYIDCLYWKNERIFMNSEGSIVPCCHINHLEYITNPEYNDYHTWLLEEGGKLLNSLYYNSMDDIIESYLSPIYNRIETDPLKVCTYQCKKRGHNNIIVKSND